MKKLILISILLITSVFSFGQTIHEQSIDNSIRVYGHIEIDDSYIRAKVGMFDTIWSGGIGIVIDTIGGTVDIIGGNLVIEQNAITVGDNITINSSGISVNDGTEPFSLGGISVTDGTIVLGTTAFESDIAGRLKFENDSLYLYTDGSDWVNLSAGGGGGGVSISDVQSEIEDSLNAFRSDAIDIETADISTTGTWTFGEDVEINAYIKANNIPRSVFAYGAVGDGVTDDWEAIQNCIDVGVGTVIIGESRLDTFIVSQPIKPLSYQTIIRNGVIKIQNGDSCAVLTNTTKGSTTTFKVSTANITKFSEGQWVGLKDNTDGPLVEETGTYYGWTGLITDITDTTITLDRVATYSMEAANGLEVGHVQPVIICDGIEHVKIIGNGVVDGNRQNQYNVRALDNSGSGVSEAQDGACMGLVIWQCNDIEISGEFKNAIMHNICISNTGDPSNSESRTLYNNDIHLDGVISYDANEKNILFNCSRDVSVINSKTYGAIAEDGLTFYGNTRRAKVQNFTTWNNGRYGLMWGSVLSYDLELININIDTCGTAQQGAGLALLSGNVLGTNISMKNITGNGLELRRNADNVSLSIVFMENINATKVGSSKYGCISLNGEDVLSDGNGLENINISNATIINSNGIGVLATSSALNMKNVKIRIGGIYNLAGQYYDIGTTDVEIEDFDPYFVYDTTFIPENDSTRYLWRGDSGMLYDASKRITNWYDRITGANAAQSSDTLKPDSALIASPNYASFDKLSANVLTVATPGTIGNIPINDFTISGMINFDTAYTSQYIIGKYVGGTSYYGLYLNSNNLNLIVISGTTKIQSYTLLNTILKDTDYIFSISYDRSEGRAVFYLNGDGTEVTNNIPEATPAAYTFNTGFNLGAQRTAGNSTMRGRIYWIQYDYGIKDIDWHYNFYNYLTEWNAGF